MHHLFTVGDMACAVAIGWCGMGALVHHLREEVVPMLVNLALVGILAIAILFIHG